MTEEERANLKKQIEKAGKARRKVKEALETLVETVWESGVADQWNHVRHIYRELLHEERLVQAANFRRLACLAVAIGEIPELVELYAHMPASLLNLRIAQYLAENERVEIHRKDLLKAVQGLGSPTSGNERIRCYPIPPIGTDYKGEKERLAQEADKIGHGGWGRFIREIED